MGNVYQNGYCNIAATSASDGSEGYSFKRNPGDVRTFQIIIPKGARLHDGELFIGSFVVDSGKDIWSTNIGQSPLLKLRSSPYLLPTEAWGRWTPPSFSLSLSPRTPMLHSAQEMQRGWSINAMGCDGMSYSSVDELPGMQGRIENHEVLGEIPITKYPSSLSSFEIRFETFQQIPRISDPELLFISSPSMLPLL